MWELISKAGLKWSQYQDDRFPDQPFAHHSEKQLAAMRMAQADFKEVPIKKLAYDFLMRLLP